MSLTLNEYTVKLINKILFSDSQEEVKQVIDDAMKAMDQNKVNGHLILRFIDKIASELELFNPMNEDARQWSNIRFAKIIFNRMKHRITEPVHQDVK